MNTEIVKHDGNGAALRREEFGAAELAPIVETSATAVAATAEAKVKARAVVALQRPRDMDLVRTKLLKDCTRPGFAAVARYSIPRGGKKIEGPTIRFAEAAARALGNLEVSVDPIYDDREKRILRVEVTDLESNHVESMPVIIDKTIERREVKAGDEVIGTRQNSMGQMVYRIAAPEGELIVKQAALTAKARRNLILSHLPGDIKEECEAKAREVVAAGTKADPDAARKRLVDSFASIGVMPDEIKRVIGHDLGSCSAAEIDELRAIYAGIASGDATWKEIAAEKVKVAAAEAKGEAVKGGKIEELKANLRAKKQPEPAPEKKREVSPVDFWAAKVSAAGSLDDLEKIEADIALQEFDESTAGILAAAVKARRAALTK
jgi:hypothetical protein